MFNNDQVEGDRMQRKKNAGLIWFTYGCLVLLIVSLTGCNWRWCWQYDNTNAEFTISIASGGGFTGLITGYDLNESGLVVKWQQLPGAEKTTLGKYKVSPEKIAAFYTELNQPVILTTPVLETGNMTTTVTLNEGDKTYSWSWDAASTGEAEKDSIMSWYKKVNEFCQSLTKKTAL